MPREKRVKKYRSMPPYSRDAEQKYILKVIHHISSEVKDFYRDFVKNVRIDYHACVGSLDKLLEEWEQDKTSLETWRDYINAVKYKTIDRKLKGSSELKDLYFICDRTSHFEGLVPDLGRELMNCMYDHLYKYCISFELETKGIEIKAVQQYETDISIYRKNMDSKFDSIADCISQADALGSPFHDLVTNGSQQESLIGDVCNMILDVCQTAKSWLKQDKQYSNEIWKEMQIYQSNRINLKDEEAKLIKKRQNVIKKLSQIEKLKNSATKNYINSKRNRDKLKMRIEVVEDKIERISNTLERKKEAYNKTEEHKSLESPLTPRMQITYDIRLENLRREVYSLDGRVDPTERHLQNLKLDLKDAIDITYEYKVEAATFDNEQHDIRKEILPLDIELDSVRDGIRTNESKLVVMQRIRSHVAMADTLRKLHKDEELEKFQPELENLFEALSLVSEHVGLEWKVIYPKLPFIPPRDQSKKSRDIEILDTVAMRCDQTHVEQARKAFEKWLSFNRRGTIQQLIRTLRKVKKVELASQLEERFSIDNVY